MNLKIDKGEIIIMNKGFSGRAMAKGISLSLGLMLVASVCFAAAGFDSLSEQTIVEKIGNVIKLISGIMAPVILAAGLLIGGVKSMNGSEDATTWIKRGLIGGILCAGAWGLSKLLISVMG